MFGARHKLPEHIQEFVEYSDKTENNWFQVCKVNIGWWSSMCRSGGEAWRLSCVATAIRKTHNSSFLRNSYNRSYQCPNLSKRNDFVRPWPGQCNGLVFFAT